jgi:hypothetical protein
MEQSLALQELLKTALANGAVGFTLRTGLHPVVYFARGVQAYDTRASTSEEIEEILRELMKSREMRQFREEGVVHCRSLFDGGASLLCGAKLEGKDIHVELRKIAA